MFSPTQLDSFHVVIIRDGSEILVERSALGLRLPVITIPPHKRPAEELTAATESRWNLKTYCLFTLPSGDPRSIRSTAVLELCSPCDAPPEGLDWHATASLSQQDFDDGESYSVIERALAALDDNRSVELQGPFGRTGWLELVTEWTASQAAAVGLRLSGAFRQLNASPTFSLMRFETDGPALWFKAVGEPNLREYSITLALSKNFPSHVPRMIAARANWNAWLSLEAEGAPLRECSAVKVWARAAGALASLQIASFGQTLHMIDAGCRDVRPPTLLSLTGPFFEVMSLLMAQQTKPSPTPLSRAELLELQGNLEDTLSELLHSEIPNTVGHLDVNPGNIISNGRDCVFLDWAEGSAGHPFLTFRYLLEHFQRSHPGRDPADRSLTAAYVRSWRSFASPKEISRALRLSSLLAVFAYATCGDSWRDPNLLERPKAAAYLRSLTRRMKREADILSVSENERNVSCLA
jgi:hypothetical protein